MPSAFVLHAETLGLYPLSQLPGIPRDHFWCCMSLLGLALLSSALPAGVTKAGSGPCRLMGNPFSQGPQGPLSRVFPDDQVPESSKELRAHFSAVDL